VGRPHPQGWAPQRVRGLQRHPVQPVRSGPDHGLVPHIVTPPQCRQGACGLTTPHQSLTLQQSEPGDLAVRSASMFIAFGPQPMVTLMVPSTSSQLRRCMWILAFSVPLCLFSGVSRWAPRRLACCVHASGLRC
jgi:hypothetical protein